MSGKDTNGEALALNADMWELRRRFQSTCGLPVVQERSLHFSLAQKPHVLCTPERGTIPWVMILFGFGGYHIEPASWADFHLVDFNPWFYCFLGKPGLPPPPLRPLNQGPHQKTRKVDSRLSFFEGPLFVSGPKSNRPFCGLRFQC